MFRLYLSKNPLPSPPNLASFENGEFIAIRLLYYIPSWSVREGSLIFIECPLKKKISLVFRILVFPIL